MSNAATGEVARGPEKRNDDLGNGHMFCAYDVLPPAARLEQWVINDETLSPAPLLECSRIIMGSIYEDE